MNKAARQSLRPAQAANMNEHERQDRDNHRTFWFCTMLFVGLPVVLGAPTILLHYGEGQLLADVVKILLGFVGGIGGGALLSRARG